ncbi:MAG TPA: hypothetical protein VIV11_21705 [Kofleriaceae bacterium]
MIRLLCAVLLLSCSGKPSAPAHPTGGGTQSGSQTTGSVASDGRSDEQCDKLIDHVVSLAINERPADQKPTDDERAKIVTDLRTTWTPKCRAMTSSGYDCALKSQSLAAVDACSG